VASEIFIRDSHNIQSVCDPFCGTVNMLLSASNYSLNLYGLDISHLLTKIAKVNGFIYIPWLVYRPKNLTIFDQAEQPAVSEIELPTGVKIPHCNICSNNQHTFLMDLETDHRLSLNHGLVSVDNPDLSQDLIARKIKPDNITCAKCYNKLQKEAQ